MKRILSCVLVLILLFTSVSTTAVLALAAEASTIGFNSVEAETGDTVSLQLSINNNPGIAGLAVSLKYDTTALTLTETKKGILFSGFTAAKNFAWDESEDVTADGVLATFTFTVSEVATPGDYDIEVIVRSCTNENLDDVNCNVQNGKVTVKVKPVPATGVSLDKETLSLDTGANNTATLIATVSPDACTNKAVTWKSSDEAVATVADGVVTAVKKGTTTITVTTVDGAFTDECVVTVACAHTAKTPTAARTANCQEGGWDAYYTCDACGQLFAADGTTELNAIPTTNKDASNHTNIQPFAADTATCVHQGHNAYEKCVDCGVVSSGSDTKYYGDHNYGELKTAIGEVHTPSTLTPAVAAHYQCSLCSKYFTEAKVETTLAALTGTIPSHSYGNWVNTDADQHWKECGCGNKIEVNSHNYDNTCDTTCNTCGHVRTITHSYSAMWSMDGTNHWHECSVCHDKKDVGTHSGGTATCKAKAICSVCGASYGNYGDHNYSEIVNADCLKSVATCVSPAVYYKSCSVCGAKSSETFTYGSVDKTNHVDGRYTVGQKEATCYEEGYTGDIYCSGCDTKIETGTPISKGTHNPADVWTTDETHHWKICVNVGCGNIIDKAEHCGGEATCTEQAVCKVCGVKYGELNSNNHKNTKTINAKTPGCTEKGYTGDTYCNDCKKIIMTGTDIDPIGHTPSEWKFDERDHWKICSVEGCGTEIADSRAVHTESEWIVDKAATTAEDGSKHTECTVCGKVLNTESIPKLKEYGFDDSDKSWTQGSNNGLTLGMDADVDGITKVEIDGNTVAPENYTVNKDNSTITFSAEFLKNQTVGKHNLTITLNDGVANTQFEIKSSQKHETSPQTGDNSHLALWISLMILSLCGLAATLVIPKRRRVK